MPVQVRPWAPSNKIVKYWFVATYKINEIKRVETNLLNQSLHYYLPKIVTKKPNSNAKEEIMFPGYIFINTSIDKYSTIQYTKGIKKIIRFGETLSYMTDDEIRNINIIEQSSRSHPLVSELKIGQEVGINEGAFKGNFAKICALPSKERVGVLLHILGSKKSIEISKKHLLF